MLIGYTLSGNASNDGIFFGEDIPRGTLCEECGTCLNANYFPEYMRVHRSKKYDVAYTHDLRTVYSERFVKFVRDELGCCDDFKKIRTDYSDLYYLLPGRIVEFDSARRKTRFTGLCGICGGYESIVGAHPCFLKEASGLASGVYRTNLSFASGKSKQFLTVVSADWAESIRTQKFRGIHLEPIVSDKNWGP